MPRWCLALLTAVAVATPAYLTWHAPFVTSFSQLWQPSLGRFGASPGMGDVVVIGPADATATTTANGNAKRVAQNASGSDRDQTVQATEPLVLLLVGAGLAAAATTRRRSRV